MKAKLINGANSWRLEQYDNGVHIDTFTFVGSDFAMFLRDTLKSAGYTVEVDWDEWKKEEN